MRHVFVIVLENKSFESVFGSRPAAPYLARTLPAQGALLPLYYGIGHDSASNYIAMISGQPPTPASQSDCGDPLTSVGTKATSAGIARGDGCVYPRRFRTLGDQLTQRRLTWKGYMEGIASNCSLASRSKADSHYRRKHNPFVFFRSLRDSGQCAANDVSLSEKTFANFRFEVRNKGGHSARPVPDNAIYHLAGALYRLSSFAFPFHLNEVTRAYFKQSASAESDPKVAADMRAVARDTPDMAAAARLSAALPYWNSMMRTTAVSGSSASTK